MTNFKKLRMQANYGKIDRKLLYVVFYAQAKTYVMMEKRIAWFQEYLIHA